MSDLLQEACIILEKRKNTDWEKLLTYPYQKVGVDELKRRVREEVRQKQIREEKDEKVREMYLQQALTQWTSLEFITIITFILRITTANTSKHKR